MSDAAVLAIVTGSFGLLTLIANGVIAYFVARMQKQGAVAAVEVKEVKETLQTATAQTARELKEMAKVGVDTHTLVNSNFGVQLKIYADVCWQLYEVVKTPEAKIRAEAATATLKEHMRKQAIVDSGHAS